MADQPIRFDDGAAYKRMMGVWSRLAGEIFLDWLAPGPGLCLGHHGRRLSVTADPDRTESDGVFSGPATEFRSLEGRIPG
jgi:hypothetical protein